MDGNYQFRLMPTDPPHVAPASAELSMAAGGNLTAIAYTWMHPQDGEQDGLLVIGPAEESDAVLALWGDSWHQSPAPKVLVGAVDDEKITVSYEYGGGWRWRISVDPADRNSLMLRMDNVVPESAATEGVAAGPYPAMVAQLRRPS